MVVIWHYELRSLVDIQSSACNKYRISGINSYTENECDVLVQKKGTTILYAGFLFYFGNTHRSVDAAYMWIIAEMSLLTEIM